LMLRWPGGAA